MAGDDNQQLARATGPEMDGATEDSGLAEDPLAALRTEWLLRAAEHDDTVTAAAVIAVTEPLTSDQRAQIVERLLRERQQAGASVAVHPTHSGTARWARALRSRGMRRRGPPSAGSIVIAGSLAAACTLCFWLTLPAKQLSDAERHEQAAASHERSSLAPTGSASPLSSELERVRDEAARLTALAELLVQQEKFVEAEARLFEALALRERVLGPMHEDVAATLTRLAGLYQSQQMYAKADPLYLRALEIQPPFAVF